jgi:xylose isomerase
MHGASTSCNADVFAFAAAQVKKAMEVTHQLGGEGYVFWGGREGYTTLLNTDLKREMDHLGAFMRMAVDYKREIGFKGPFYIEPKPKEPTKHQYDSDAAACLNFLREYDLLDDFKLNIETNHATLAGHTMQHELEVAAAAGALGSIDANMGDVLLGLGHRPVPDRPLPYDPGDAHHFEDGRLHHRWDKLRRQSAPRKLRADRPFPRTHRGHGHVRAWFESGRCDPQGRSPHRLCEAALQLMGRWHRPRHRARQSGLPRTRSLHAQKGDVAPNTSGRQEFLENLINEFI